MCALRTKDRRPVAIACSDLHLSLRPPLARAGEPDWFAAMGRPLDELRWLAVNHDVPVLCAGDVFDYWRSPPELINFALGCFENRPSLFAIPGQHDLPYHSADEIEKSAFWTLVQAGVVVRMLNTRYLLGGLHVHGFSFGEDIKPPGGNCGGSVLNVALVHEYTWMEGHSYPGAPAESCVKTNKSKYHGYDVVVVGDNHKGFQTTLKHKDGTRTVVYNCGGFMRRKADEINYEPRVGILYSDGTVEDHFLDTSQDVIEKTGADGAVVEGADLTGLFQELEDLAGAVPDFADAVKRALDETKAGPGVRRVVMEAMEDGGDK